MKYHQQRGRWPLCEQLISKIVSTVECTPPAKKRDLAFFRHQRFASRYDGLDVQQKNRKRFRRELTARTKFAVETVQTADVFGAKIVGKLEN